MGSVFEIASLIEKTSLEINFSNISSVISKPINHN